MPRQIGRNYKTWEAARKRARFERLHQDHLMRRYEYIVVPSNDRTVYRVFRVLPGEDPQAVADALARRA